MGQWWETVSVLGQWCGRIWLATPSGGLWVGGGSMVDWMNARECTRMRCVRGTRARNVGHVIARALSVNGDVGVGHTLLAAEPRRAARTGAPVARQWARVWRKTAAQPSERPYPSAAASKALQTPSGASIPACWRPAHGVSTRPLDNWVWRHKKTGRETKTVQANVLGLISKREKMH